MNSTGHTVVQFDVDLRQDIALINTLFPDISQCGSLYYVPYNELLDGFILGNATGTVGASQEFNVSTTVLVTSSITSLLGHSGYFRNMWIKEWYLTN